MRWGNRDHRKLLIESPERDRVWRWNSWRRRHPSVTPDLTRFDFSGLNLEGINLRHARLANTDFVRANLAYANLRDARLCEASLQMADLYRANVDGADLSGAYLGHARLDEASFRRARFLKRRISHADLEFASLLQANFSNAVLREAKLVGADLTDAKFDGADLRKADLGLAILRGTSFRGANLSGSRLWRISARNLGTDEKTIQKSLSVRFDWWTSRPGWMSVRETTVDDIRVAQFFDVVSEYGAVAKLVKAGAMSVVLILGRFTSSRKAVLAELDRALRIRGKTPVVFDFPGPENRELSDTVRFVAAMAEFVIVDLTAPSSVPLELQAIVPDLMVPVVPIIKSGHRGFAMFADLQRRYLWVLPPVAYASSKDLVRHLDTAVLERAQRMARALQRRRQTAVSRPQSVRRTK